MLPQTLKYQDKVVSAPARSLRANIQPSGGSTYGLNDNIVINIPTQTNQVLCPQESYLKFDVVVTNSSGSASSYRWDSCGSHGLFQSVKVWHGSNSLESIENYNQLVKILFDMQMPSDNVYNKQNILSGTRNDLVVNMSSSATALSADGSDAATTQALANSIKAAINNSQISAYQRNSGELLGGSIADAASTTRRTYCLNLVSILGSLCPVYLPVFACNSAPLRLELQIVSNLLQAMTATSGVGSVTISNVEYIANFIELSDEALSVVKNASGGNSIQFVVPQYRNSVGSVTGLVNNATTTPIIAIPFKFSSLKSIVVSQRVSNQAAVRTFPFSSIRNGVSSYSFRVGSLTRPAKEPNTIQEMFAECLRAFGSISDPQYNCAIDLDTYSQNTNTAWIQASDTTANLQNSASFYTAIDLESYPNAEKSRLYSGFNSNTVDIFYQPTYTNAPNANIRIDAYALFDSILVFENGTAYVKF